MWQYSTLANLPAVAETTGWQSAAASHEETGKMIGYGECLNNREAANHSPIRLKMPT